jgi:hypothetical protein
LSVLGFNLTAVPLWDNRPICDEVPLAVAISADFNGVDLYNVNLYQLREAQRIQAVRGCFYDNSRNNTDVVLTALNTGQTLLLPLRTQGYMPLLLNNDAEFDLSTTAGTGIFKMTLLNFIVQPQIWNATL